MSDCNCQNTEIIPDFTREGFDAAANGNGFVDTTTEHTVESLHQQFSLDGVQALDLKACVSASYSNGQVCFKFPVIGNVCFKVPVKIPANASLKVCGQVCLKTFPPIPQGLKVTLYVNDKAVWSGVVWGKC
jgi:hypothetical protein